MTCCIARPVRPIVFTAADIGKHQEFAEFDCECGSCCKRVALFAPRPKIEMNAISSNDEWLVKVIADITFGCKKGFCFGGNVEVDFKNGVILDLMGDYVSVGYKVIEVTNLNLEGGVIAPMSFGAMIACCGAGAARGCATRTTERITIGNAGSKLIPIPPFAYAVQFATEDTAALFVSTVAFAQVGSGISSPIVLSAFGNNLSDPWTIINGARNLLIVNGSGASITFEAVFLIGV